MVCSGGVDFDREGRSSEQAKIVTWIMVRSTDNNLVTIYNHPLILAVISFSEDPGFSAGKSGAQRVAVADTMLW